MEERCWRVERRVRECRTWTEEEMSVPLAERITTSIGEKEELREVSVSRFPEYSSSTSVIAFRSQLSFGGSHGMHHTRDRRLGRCSCRLLMPIAWIATL